MVDPEGRKILQELLKDGRLSNVDLSKRVAMSESSCLRRTRALEEDGVIAGYRAVVQPEKLGYAVSAFILVNLDQRVETQTLAFQNLVGRDPRIAGGAAITGVHDVILHVHVRDMDDLSHLTMDTILQLPSVRDVSTCIVMREFKEDRGPRL